MKKIFTILLSLCSVLTYANGNARLFTVSDGLPTNQIRQIVQLPNLQMLVVTECGTSLFDGKEFITQPCNLDSVMPLPKFGAFGYLWQGDSLLWLKDFYSLYIFDARNKTFRYDYAQRIQNPEISRFIGENGDSLTHAIINQNDSLREHFEKLVEGTDLEGSWMQTVCRDHQGGLWMGTRQGGILYERPPHPMATVSQLQNDDVPLKVAELSPGKLLIGGLKGLYIYDCASQSIERTLVEGDLSCTDICADSYGRIWVSSGLGLYCYDNGTLTLYDGHNTKGLLHSKIRFALPLDGDRLLVCNLQNELGIFYPKKKFFSRLNTKLPELSSYRTMVAACQLNHPELIAVCTQNGLFVLDTKKSKVQLMECLKDVARYSHKYTSIYHDKRDRVWLGTPAGLLLLQPEAYGYAVKRLTKEDGLPNNSIQSITEDIRGNLWVGTAMGVCRINVTNDGIVYILPLWIDDGLPRVELTERGICPSSDGIVYFTSDAGLISLKSEDFNQQQPPQKVEIVGVQVMGKPLVSVVTPMEFNYNDNNIVIKFSALNYATPETTMYRFRLVGVEDKWNYGNGKEGLLGTAYYALHPDTYTFEVQARIGVGEWGPLTTLELTVNPPLWLTWWAKLIYLLMALAVVYAAIHFYLKKRKYKLERENEEKINRLFELRDEARRQFALSADIDPDKVASLSEDEELATRMMSAITRNIDNPDYTVDMLASDVAMSRASLYKKSSTMLGITPNDFMRNVRLKQAETLLSDSSMPISEVAERVGFSTSRYFSQCFRQMYGVTPSEYREGK
jgi:AraC-like DNA-binding protein